MMRDNLAVPIVNRCLMAALLTAATLAASFDWVGVAASSIWWAMVALGAWSDRGPSEPVPTSGAEEEVAAARPRMPTMEETADDPGGGEPKRLRFTFTKTMLVDVNPEEADWLLDKQADYMDVVDAAMRFRRIAAHDHEYLESDLGVEDASDGWNSPYGVTPVDGVNGREKYLWSARHFVIEARTELSRGRYRDGVCPELDAVNRELGLIEDRLRLMAIAADEAVKS